MNFLKTKRIKDIDWVNWDLRENYYGYDRNLMSLDAQLN